MADPNRIVALTAVETAVSAAVASVVQATRSPSHGIITPCSKCRRMVLYPLERDEIPFKRTFGMRHESFDRICALVARHWTRINRPIGATSQFQLREQVAVTIYFLTHDSNSENVADIFEMTENEAAQYVWKVMDVLLSDAVKSEFFTFPSSDEAWNKLSDEFEAICGYPNCCLAIGGMLVEIERPRQWEGWYCSKHFPAENVQLVVDAKFRVRSMDVRPGGITDRKTLRYSRFGRNLTNILPEGKHVVGHAGYSLSKSVIVPYPATSIMSAEEKLFNSLQMTTQRAVKRTEEMIKKRFRILQSPLRQKTEDGDVATRRMAQIISTAIVLHNILVDLDDLVEVDSSMGDDTDEEEMDEGSGSEDSDLDEDMDGHATGQRDAIKDYLYVNRDHIVTHFG